MEGMSCKASICATIGGRHLGLRCVCQVYEGFACTYVQILQCRQVTATQPLLDGLHAEGWSQRGELCKRGCNINTLMARGTGHGSAMNRTSGMCGNQAGFCYVLPILICAAIWCNSVLPVEASALCIPIRKAAW